MEVGHYMDPKKNYSVSELECLAIVEGVKTYKAHLTTGIPFTIVTDHKALTCLNSLTNSQNYRLARWVLYLQGFRYKVVYRKGNKTMPMHFRDKQEK